MVDERLRYAERLRPAILLLSFPADILFGGFTGSTGSTGAKTQDTCARARPNTCKQLDMHRTKTEGAATPRKGVGTLLAACLIRIATNLVLAAYFSD